MDTKDTNNTKYLEEDQVYETFNLTKMLTITFYDSFSIFSVCCHENIIVVSSLKDDNEDDEGFTLTKPVDFFTPQDDVTQPPRFAWAVNVDCATVYLFKQHDKMSLLVSLYTLSNYEHKRNYFEKTLWLHQSLEESTLIIQKTFKSENVVLNVNQMHDISSTIHFIINRMYSIAENNNCPSCHSSLMCMVFTYMLSNENFFLNYKNYYTLLLEGNFDVDAEKNQKHIRNCCTLLTQRSFDVDIGKLISMKGLEYVDKRQFCRDDHNECSASIVSGTVSTVAMK